ncbi:MAG: hypothetical protein M3O22_08450 [Pseudomonadota bacterium]|nr:hypothetical protein [Pseudomonadota bacterium]
MTFRTYDIVQITDCHDENLDSGQLAAVKVRMAYSAWAEKHGLPVSQIQMVPAEEFNTVDAGFRFSEIVSTNPMPERLLVAVNVAPAMAGKSANNERELFVLGKLKNGLHFGGTYKGYCLSYIKPLIQEVFYLTDSNNGSQFRSLEVLPPALVEYARGTIRKDRLEAFDHTAVIPDAPSVSHVLAIDNFRNVKIRLSPEDRVFLEGVMKAGGIEGSLPVIDISFAGKSVEFAVSPKPSPSKPHWRVVLGQRMFDVEEGDSVLSLASSSRLLERNGQWTGKVAQLATIRRRPHVALGYEVPPLGAAVYFRR